MAEAVEEGFNAQHHDAGNVAAVAVTDVGARFLDAALRLPENRHFGIAEK